MVADYNSKFPWKQKLSATSTKDVIFALSFVFVGTPKDVICDNAYNSPARKTKSLPPCSASI